MDQKNLFCPSNEILLCSKLAAQYGELDSNLDDDDFLFGIQLGNVDFDSVLNDGFIKSRANSITQKISSVVIPSLEVEAKPTGLEEDDMLECIDFRDDGSSDIDDMLSFLLCSDLTADRSMSRSLSDDTQSVSTDRAVELSVDIELTRKRPRSTESICSYAGRTTPHTVEYTCSVAECKHKYTVRQSFMSSWMLNNPH